MGKFHDLMDRQLRIRGYSEATRQTYLGRVRQFVRFFMRPPDELTAEDVNEYQLHLTKERKLSWSAFNVSVCALRFFYREVLHVDWEVKHIPYQRTGRKLPVVLSQDEVGALLDTVTNVKHRSILMVLYSGGLRVSEATHLRIPDIDSHRMTIRVYQGKGRKDRYVMLSEKLLDTLRRYWWEYRPEHWLFPGSDPSSPLHRSAVDRIFLEARAAARIRKPVHPHTLRHSFATHLLERGVNIRVIQRLLGHKSVRSTEIYTHVAGSYLRDTRSPLDDLLPDPGSQEPAAAD